MNKKQKKTLGQRTIPAILNCSSLRQFDRLCYVGSMALPNYKELAWAFIDAFVDWREKKCDKEELDKYATMLGKSVDNAKFDPFWGLIYRAMLLFRRA